MSLLSTVDVSCLQTGILYLEAIMFRYSNHYFAWRVLTTCKNCSIQFLSSVSSPPNIPPNESINKETTEKNLPLQNIKKSRSVTGTILMNKFAKMKKDGSRNLLVDAAFNSLNVKKPQNIMDNLQAAETVNDLLVVTETKRFTQYHALQALSILTNWTSEKKVKISDFESDPRFIRLCQILGGNKGEHNVNTHSGDLALVLGVAGGDEAAKLVSSITFPQQLKVLSSLALKKRRTIPLLKALASSIVGDSQNLNVKESADVLYAMSILNFPDDALFKKAASDICLCLKDNRKPAVVGSILTSAGILKYKNKVLLETLSEWIEEHISICREQDLTAFLLTLAAVHHEPKNASQLFKKVLTILSSVGLKAQGWLDVVWSLVVLNRAEKKHLQIVLDPIFIEKLHNPRGFSADGGSLSAPIKVKLLNVNAAAQCLFKEYSGPFLTDSNILTFTIQRSREKQILVDSVIDALSNLFSVTYLKTSVDTGYGFLIDGVCAIDRKCNPLPLTNTSNDMKRIAVYVCDYHDLCRESAEVSGPVVFHLRVLKELGYNVMTVTYLDFNPSEKLIKRVKYLESRLKAIAKECV